ncbi:MAG: hypothetical protein ACHQT8_03020 [Chlamydiales bacterium]
MTNAVPSPVGSPGGTVRTNEQPLNLAKYQAHILLNALSAHRDQLSVGPALLLNLGSNLLKDASSPDISPHPDSSPIDEVNGLGQKIIKDEGKKDGLSRSEECPTVRYNNGNSKRFTFRLNEIQDKSRQDNLKKLRLTKFLEAHDKADPSIFLYDPSPTNEKE